MIRGQARLVGDDVDTDAILPGRYLSLQDPAAMAVHVFEGVDPEFAGRARAGDILIAGRNFGGGSSREHAPLALKALGLGAVIAASFARIFYRNAVNVGLPIFVSPSAVGAARQGVRVSIDPDSGEIRIGDRLYVADPPSDVVAAIIAAGGLVPWVRAQMETSA